MLLRANCQMFCSFCVSHLLVMLLKYIMGNLHRIISHLDWGLDLPLSLSQQDQQAEQGEFSEFHESLISALYT